METIVQISYFWAPRVMLSYTFFSFIKIIAILPIIKLWFLIRKSKIRYLPHNNLLTFSIWKANQR